MSDTPLTNAFAKGIYNAAMSAASDLPGYGWPEVSPEDAYAEALKFAGKLEAALAAARAEVERHRDALAWFADYIIRERGGTPDHPAWISLALKYADERRAELARLKAQPSAETVREMIDAAGELFEHEDMRAAISYREGNAASSGMAGYNTRKRFQRVYDAMSALAKVAQK